MNMKYNIGDKVIPTSTSYTGNELKDTVWNKAQEIKQPYLIVTEYEPKYGVYWCKTDCRQFVGNYWLEKDLINYGG